MLCNVGGGRCQISVKKALRRCRVQRYQRYEGWVDVEFAEEKRYVTLDDAVVSALSCLCYSMVF